MNPHRRATYYFRALLIGGTAVSLAGNVSHAVMTSAAHLPVAVAVAAVPPIALVATTHGVAEMVRARVQGRVYTMVVWIVALVAAAAFALSFAALRDLAAMLGYVGWLSALLPVVVDATVVAATAVLVVLGQVDQVEVRETTVDTALVDSTALAPETRWSAAATTDIPVVADNRHGDLVAVAEEQPTTATTEIPLVVDDHQEVVVDPQPPVVDDQPPAPLHLVAATASGDHQAAAATIAARGVVKVDAATIATVLAALADGRSQRATAELAGVDRSVVAKIKTTAAALVAA